MSEKESGQGKRVDNARARTPPPAKGDTAGAESGHPQYLPRRQVSSDEWRPGSTAQSASQVNRSTRRVESDDAPRRSGSAPKLSSGSGAGRAQVRPAPPPADTQSRPAQEPSSKGEAPPLPPRAASRGRRSQSAGTHRPTSSARAQERTAPPLNLPRYAAEHSTPAPKTQAAGPPAWAQTGPVGPTAAAGWGQPGQGAITDGDIGLARGIGIARPGDGPLAGAATWWDGESWWARTQSQSKPAAKSWFDGESWWVRTDPKAASAKAASGPAAWAQKGAAQAAWGKPVEHAGPAVWLKPGPALAAVFRPVVRTESKPAVWAQRGSARAAWGQPVEHAGPPVWMQKGAAVAAVFRPVVKKAAPKPFWLRPASEGPWVFQAGAGSGLWIFRGSTKTKDTKSKAQRTATDSASQTESSTGSPAAKPWTARGFIEIEADTTPSVATPQTYPYTRGRESATSGYPSVRGRMQTSWTTGSVEISAAQGSAAPPLRRTRGQTSDAEAQALANAVPTHPDTRLKAGTAPPLRGTANEQIREAPPPNRVKVLKSQNKFGEEEVREQEDSERTKTPDREPPPKWMGAVGYLMQLLIADRANNTQEAAPFVARNKPLQELGRELDQDELHGNHPFDFPSLQDIVDSMSWEAENIVRYFNRQKREMGFDNMRLFNEVGLVHNYQAFNASRDRINELLRAGELNDDEMEILTNPRPIIAETRWGKINDIQLRLDMQTVLQSSTVYRDIGPNGEPVTYLAPDGVRPDIVRIFWNNGPGNEDMPYLVDALGIIITGKNKRRNIQDFGRWVNIPVDYINGQQITLLKAFELISQRVATGKAEVEIDEVKTHPGKFNRYHSEIEVAQGFVPEPGTSLKDTNLGADLGGTLHAVKHLIENTLGHDWRRYARHTRGRYLEISLDMLHRKTRDTVHAGAFQLVIPAPKFRMYGISIDEARHEWKRREGSIRNQGRIALTGNVYRTAYVLPAE